MAEEFVCGVINMEGILTFADIPCHSRGPML